MIRAHDERGASRTPLPNDHVQTLIELLRPAGPDLARRLVAALLLAPVEEREGIVEAIEARMVELFVESEKPAREIDVLESEAQREGYVEQVFRTYEVERDQGAQQEPKAEDEPAKRGRKGTGS